MNNLLEYKGGKVEGGRGKKIIPFSNTSYFPTSPFFFSFKKPSQRTIPGISSQRSITTFVSSFRSDSSLRRLPPTHSGHVVSGSRSALYYYYFFPYSFSLSLRSIRLFPIILIFYRAAETHKIAGFY